MSDYSEFFLNSGSNIAELELLEISHPNFSKTYFIVRNATNGITVTLETSVVQAFEYYPLQITPAGSGDDLDQVLKIQLGDLGSILPQELDAVSVAGTFGTKPVLKYRTYRSDDLSAPLYGPITMEISSLTFKREGAAFEAHAPRLNSTATGELYSTSRFPMLRGFV
jgi:hypothetical protein